MKVHKVLVDTNSLIYAVQKKRDLFEDLQRFLGAFELIMLSSVKEELEKQAQRAKKLKKTRSPAKIALEMLHGRAKIVSYSIKGKTTDDLILDYAQQNSCIVLTNDRGLKKRLESAEVKVLPPEIFTRKLG